jgi:hypothetical protein
MGCHWYLIKDTARPLQCARPPLPHQLDFILAKLTLQRMNHKRGGSVAPRWALLVPAKPVESGGSLSPTLPCHMSYAGAVLSTIGGDCQLLLQILQTTTAHESVSNGRPANANGLVAALVVASYLGGPIWQMRPFPPTLYQ